MFVAVTTRAGSAFHVLGALRGKKSFSLAQYAYSYYNTVLIPISYIHGIMSLYLNNFKLCNINPT